MTSRGVRFAIEYTVAHTLIALEMKIMINYISFHIAKKKNVNIIFDLQKIP